MALRSIPSSRRSSSLVARKDRKFAFSFLTPSLCITAMLLKTLAFYLTPTCLDFLVSLWKVFAAPGSSGKKKLLSMRIKVELAQSLLLPILDYGDVCVIDHKENLLSTLQRLYNLCIWFFNGLRKFDHVSECRKKLQWLCINLHCVEHVLSLLSSKGAV